MWVFRLHVNERCVMVDMTFYFGRLSINQHARVCCCCCCCCIAFLCVSALCLSLCLSVCLSLSVSLHTGCAPCFAFLLGGSKIHILSPSFMCVRVCCVCVVLFLFHPGRIEEQPATDTGQPRPGPVRPPRCNPPVQPPGSGKLSARRGPTGGPRPGAAGAGPGDEGLRTAGVCVCVCVAARLFVTLCSLLFRS